MPDVTTSLGIQTRMVVDAVTAWSPRRTLAVGAVVLAGLAVSFFSVDGATAGAASRPPDPAGFYRVHVAKDGFSVAIPNSWVAFDFTRPASQSRYRLFRQQHPGALTLPPNLNNFPVGTQLYASDPTWPNQVYVRLTSGITALPSAKQLRAALARVPHAQRPDIQAIRVDGHPAIRTIRPCIVRPSAGPASCGSSESITVAGRLGVLTFDLSLGPNRPDGSNAIATTQLVIQSLSLH